MNLYNIVQSEPSFGRASHADSFTCTLPANYEVQLILKFHYFGLGPFLNTPAITNQAVSEIYPDSYRPHFMIIVMQVFFSEVKCAL